MSGEACIHCLYRSAAVTPSPKKTYYKSQNHGKRFFVSTENNMKKQTCWIGGSTHPKWSKIELLQREPSLSLSRRSRSAPNRTRRCQRHAAREGHNLWLNVRCQGHSEFWGKNESEGNPKTNHLRTKFFTCYEVFKQRLHSRGKYDLQAAHPATRKWCGLRSA